VVTLRNQRIFAVLVAITMSASVAIGRITGNLTLAVVFSVLGLGALILYRRISTVEKPMRDERDLLIEAKSSTAALQLTLGGGAFLGSVLIFLNYMGYAAVDQAGFTLLILANAGALIQQGYRDHYKREYGG
jgi:uncharacterized membrane protein